MSVCCSIAEVQPTLSSSIRNSAAARCADSGRRHPHATGAQIGAGLEGNHDDRRTYRSPNRCALMCPVRCALTQCFSVEMQAWSALLSSVQTGTSGWEQALGIGHYAYFAQNRRPTPISMRPWPGTRHEHCPTSSPLTTSGNSARLSTSVADVGHFYRASCRLIRTFNAYCVNQHQSRTPPRIGLNSLIY
jgi:hypothetical protein